MRRSGCYSQERDCEGCGTDIGGGGSGLCLSLGVALILTTDSCPRCVGVKNCVHTPPIKLLLRISGFWFLDAFAKSRKATTGFVMSACLTIRMYTSAPTGRIFKKLYI